MSNISVNTITDASGGSTASINGLTPQASNMQPFNRIINGAMTIDQRNAGAAVTITTGNEFSVDRFQGITSVSSKFSLQQTTTVPAGFINSLKVTSLSAYTVGSSEQNLIRYNIEGVNFGDLAWGTASASTVTLSFKVYSSLTGTFGGSIFNYDGSRSYPFTYTIGTASTWTDISVTIAGDQSGVWLSNNAVGATLAFGLGVGSALSGTAGSWAGAYYSSATGAVSILATSGATFYITGVQLEAGSTASSFAHENYSDTLQKCQRYYQLNLAGAGWTGSTITLTGAAIGYQTTMRTAPTAVLVNGTGAVLDGGVALRDLSAITVYDATNIGGYLYGSLSTTTNNKPHILRQGRVSFSAEL
jgi:hypothetical protein